MAALLPVPPAAGVRRSSNKTPIYAKLLQVICRAGARNAATDDNDIEYFTHTFIPSITRFGLHQCMSVKQQQRNP